MVVVHPYMAQRVDEPLAGWDDIAMTDGRLHYLDEVAADRDGHGVLWVRQPIDGTGASRFGKIHSLRQQHAAVRLLCQVCGGEPDENGHGVLWLLPLPPATIRRRRRHGPVLVTYPPICVACLEKAKRQCPPLRTRHSVLRVQEVVLYGVLGIRFRIRDGRLISDRKEEYFAYDDPALRMVVAIQQVLALHNPRLVAGYPSIKSKE